MEVLSAVLGTPYLIIVALVGLAHMGFMYAEMFRWDWVARRVGRMKDQAMIDRTRALGANQGLYNGFLGGALLVSLVLAGPAAAALQIWGLVCVALAGLVGAQTMKSVKLVIAQTVPAVIGLGLMLL